MMMRFASLLLAFFLLTSAATVYAECTWVLWDNEWSLAPSFRERWFEKRYEKVGRQRCLRKEAGLRAGTVDPRRPRGK
jgi:hypothetical protein